MAHRHPAGWEIRICRECGAGYDRFKAGGARGQYCSAACLEQARSNKRAAWQWRHAEALLERGGGQFLAQ